MKFVRSVHSEAAFSMGLGLLSVLGILFLLVGVATAKSFDSQHFSADEVLESFGFPAGLIPANVEGYSLESNGNFVLRLRSSCRFNIPSAYPVRYSSRITGRISCRRIRDLKGVSVQALFIWWNVDAVSVIHDDVVFQVGPVSESYPFSNFYEKPVCETRSIELPAFDYLPPL
eukprot:c26493_g1_i4 orf=510-1028(+)